MTPTDPNLSEVFTWISKSSTNIQKFEILATGHNIMLEEPDMVNKLTEGYLQKLNIL